VNRYVIDASVAIKWFIPEIHSESALRVRYAQSQFHVPEFITLELGNVLAKKIRRRELMQAEGEAILREIKHLPLRRHSDGRLFPVAYQLALATQRSLYDCLYLALAGVVDGAVITADHKFYAALANGPYSTKVIWVENLAASIGGM